MNVPDAATQPQFDPGCSNMTAHCCRLHLQAVNAALQASPAVQRFTPCLELERSVGSLHAVLSRLQPTGLLRKAAHLSSVSSVMPYMAARKPWGLGLCCGASWPSDVVICLQYSQTSMLRPYHPEHTPSRPIREVKLDWAQLVLG